MNQEQPAQKPVSTGKMLGISTLMIAFASAIAIGDFEVNKMQDADPVFVTNAAQKQVEAMGMTNVKFSTFNKAAEKPAEVTFTADKTVQQGTLHYVGTGECSSTGCTKLSVTLNPKNPYTAFGAGS